MWMRINWEIWKSFASLNSRLPYSCARDLDLLVNEYLCTLNVWSIQALFNLRPRLPCVIVNDGRKLLLPLVFAICLTTHYRFPPTSSPQTVLASWSSQISHSWALQVAASRLAACLFVKGNACLTPVRYDCFSRESCSSLGGTCTKLP